MKLNCMILCAAVVATAFTAAVAQEPVADIPVAPVHTGSLFRASEGAPATDPDDPHSRSPVADVSFMAVNPPRPHKYKKHDLVTVVIHEESDSQTTGQNNIQKKQDFDMALQQFIKLGGGGALPGIQLATPQSTLPEVQFKYDNNRQNTANQQRTDVFSGRIQAEVVDVKPNGNLVIEATKHIHQDREEQTFLLTGECRADDVAIDNSVLSTQIAKLTLTKNTTGEVKNGTKGGWGNQLWDKINPF
jgi:flagellar L-ring protein FlgH